MVISVTIFFMCAIKVYQFITLITYFVINDFVALVTFKNDKKNTILR